MIDPQTPASDQGSAASTPFKMSFTKPEPPPVGTSSVPATLPAHILSVEPTANGIGQVVTVQVPAVGGTHEFTYDIPATQKACFTFKHRGHFHLDPTYDPNQEGTPGTGEGSARDHGNPAQGIPLPEDNVEHPDGLARKVTWKITYQGHGDPSIPYELHIELGGCPQ